MRQKFVAGMLMNRLHHPKQMIGIFIYNISTKKMKTEDTSLTPKVKGYIFQRVPSSTLNLNNQRS
jgi:hypothetical protein